MKTPRPQILLGVLSLGLSAGSLRSATPVIGAQLFQDTNARIEELFQYRNNPPKLPGPLDNPFRTNDPAIPVANPGSPANPGTLVARPLLNETPDEAMLRMAYGGLTFGGLLQVGDRQMVVINKATYKEGGLLTVRIQGSSVYLRIVSLTKDSITLGLNEARLTLHF